MVRVLLVSLVKFVVRSEVCAWRIVFVSGHMDSFEADFIVCVLLVKIINETVVGGTADFRLFKYDVST